MLVDSEIRSFVEYSILGISPYNEKQLQPNSYDVKLDNHIKIINPDTNIDIIDPYMDNSNVWIDYIIDDKYILQPEECILGSTVEYFMLPDDISARVEGKSSLGRYFIGNHITAGFIDAGFCGNITLEIKNNFNKPFVLYPNMSIGQIAFDLNSKCENPYNGKYQYQKNVQDSKYYLNNMC